MNFSKLSNCSNFGYVNANFDYDKVDQVYYDFFSKRQRIDLAARVYKCQKACGECMSCNHRKNFEPCYHDCETCSLCQENDKKFSVASPYRFNRAGYFGVPHSAAYPATNSIPVPNRIPFPTHTLGEVPIATNCDLTCGRKMCDDYRVRMDMFKRCLIDTDPSECQRRFGCSTHNGRNSRNHGPINPSETNCRACWKNGFTSF